MSGDRHRVVVIGGGFGGLRAIDGLLGEDVEITLIDRRNFHLFQPLSYQVATGALAPGDVTYPLRALYKKRDDVSVVLGDVCDFDLEGRRVILSSDAEGEDPDPVPYDSLVVAAGSSYSYFGREEWAEIAGEVKSLESALSVRSRLLAAFERAELERDADLQAAALTFVVVGGGPTGVEIAGQIGELSRDTLKHDFRTIDSRDARILLVEGEDRLLLGFPESLSRSAERALEKLGVTTVLNKLVTDIANDHVVLEHKDGSTETVPTHTVVWAAGVTASPLAGILAERIGTEPDGAGRLTVEPDLTLPGHPEVSALGDMVRVGDTVYPGVAPVAIQQGHYAGERIGRRLRGKPDPGPFHYVNKGNLATIGRLKAVADFGNGKLKVGGPLAWLLWLFVHLWYLVGFQNRVVVFMRWFFSFLTRGRGSRIISAPVGE